MYKLFIQSADFGLYSAFAFLSITVFEQLANCSWTVHEQWIHVDEFVNSFLWTVHELCSLIAWIFLRIIFNMFITETHGFYIDFSLGLQWIFW